MSGKMFCTMEVGKCFEVKVEKEGAGMFQFSIKEANERKEGIPVGIIKVNEPWSGINFEQMDVSDLEIGKKYRLIAVEEAGL